jgi:hypothetical protein
MISFKTTLPGTGGTATSSVNPNTTSGLTVEFRWTDAADNVDPIDQIGGTTMNGPSYTASTTLRFAGVALPTTEPVHPPNRFGESPRHSTNKRPVIHHVSDS